MGVIIGYCRGCLREFREGEARDTSYPEPVHWACRGLVQRRQYTVASGDVKFTCVHVPG